MGATEKRRESGAACKGIGGSESARRMGRSLSGMGRGEVLAVPFTISRKPSCAAFS